MGTPPSTGRSLSSQPLQYSACGQEILLSPDLAPDGWVCLRRPDGREFWHHLALGPAPWQAEQLDGNGYCAGAQGSTSVASSAGASERAADHARQSHSHTACPRGASSRGRAASQKARQSRNMAVAHKPRVQCAVEATAGLPVEAAVTSLAQRPPAEARVGLPMESAVTPPPSRRPHTQVATPPALSRSLCERRYVPDLGVPRALPEWFSAASASPCCQGHLPQQHQQHPRPASLPSRPGQGVLQGGGAWPPHSSGADWQAQGPAYHQTAAGTFPHGASFGLGSAGCSQPLGFGQATMAFR